MPDPLYLNIWFPQFEVPEMPVRMLSVMGQFPFSAVRPGVEYVSVQPVSWGEATVLEQRFRPGIPLQEAAGMVGDFLADDFAWIFEAFWDLWSPREPDAMQGGTPGAEDDAWSPQPSLVKFVAHGPEFDEGAFEHVGHIQVDFGIDTPFLHEELELTLGAEAYVRANIQKLVSFTAAVEQNCGISGRLLWSESEENLARKLIERLQTVQ